MQEREIRLSTGREGEDWGGGAAASSLPILLLPLLLLPLLPLILLLLIHLLLLLQCSRAPPWEAASEKIRPKLLKVATSDIHLD